MMQKTCEECGRMFFGRAVTSVVCSALCKRARNTKRIRLYRQTNREKTNAYSRKWMAERYQQNPEHYRAAGRRSKAKHWQKNRDRCKARSDRIADLIAVLRTEMPELLKEFGL